MITARSALFNAYFFALTAILCVPGVVMRFAGPDHTLTIPRLWARWVLAGLRAICGIRFELHGAERLPREGPALIASRHQSAFDTLVWLTLLPRCCYVIKQELRRIPVFGGLMEPAGMILVDRSAGAGAMRHLMREAVRAAGEGRQIVIFPEGTRAEVGTIGRLHPGVAAMAARTGLPIIPVVTDSGRYWGRRAFYKRPGTIQIALLPPISAQAGRDHLMAALAAAFAQPVREPVGNSVG
jgi:1-acyl-sn-glycerol-3-phosphate acyltransferase